MSRQVSASYYQEELQQYKEEFDHLVPIVNIGGYVSNTPLPPSFTFSQDISFKLLNRTRDKQFSD